MVDTLCLDAIVYYYSRVFRTAMPSGNERSLPQKKLPRALLPVIRVRQ